MKIPTTIAYCPVVNVLATRVGPWISRSLLISFLAFLRFGTLLTNFNLGFSGKITSTWVKKEKKKNPWDSLKHRQLHHTCTLSQHIFFNNGIFLMIVVTTKVGRDFVRPEPSYKNFQMTVERACWTRDSKHKVVMINTLCIFVLKKINKQKKLND